MIFILLIEPSSIRRKSRALRRQCFVSGERRNHGRHLHHYRPDRPGNSRREVSPFEGVWVPSRCPSHMQRVNRRRPNDRTQEESLPPKPVTFPYLLSGRTPSPRRPTTLRPSSPKPPSPHGLRGLRSRMGITRTVTKMKKRKEFLGLTRVISHRPSPRGQNGGA